MKTGCGCSKISNEPYEFKIQDCNCEKPQTYSNCLLLPNGNDKDWCRLMNKVIGDFLKVIKQLECGILPDIEIILEEISLIYMNNCKLHGVTKRVFTSIEDEYPTNEYVTKEYVDLLFELYCARNGMTRPEVDLLLDNYYNKQETYNKREVYNKQETYSKDEVYNKNEVYNKQEVEHLYSMLSTLKHKLIVNQLPSLLENDTIYFVTQDDGTYRLFIYHEDRLYELAGGIDLSILANYATKEYVDSMLELFSTLLLRHVFITQEEYDALELYDINTLYFIIKRKINNKWVFGNKFPAAFSSQDN